MNGLISRKEAVGKVLKLLFFCLFTLGLLSGCDIVLGVKDEISLDFTGQILTTQTSVAEGEEVELIFQLDFPAQRNLALQLVYDSAQDSSLAPSTITISRGDIEARVSFVVPLDNIYQRRTRELDIKAYYREFLFDRTKVEITNSDAFPQLTVRNQTGAGTGTINEGTAIQFTVTLERLSDSDLDFDFDFTHLTTVAGDFNENPGTVTVPAGSWTSAFSVTTQRNAVCIPNKSFRVSFHHPDDSPWGVTHFNQTIQEYNTSTYTITNGDATVTEGGAGSVTLTASLPCSFSRNIRFNVQNTSGYTAVAGTHFTAKQETVTIPANQTDVTVNFNTLDDGIYDNNRTLRVLFNTFSPRVNAITSRTFDVSIVNAESAPTVEWTLAASSILRSSSAGTVDLAWSRTGSTLVPMEVALNYGGSAVSGVDYSGPATFNLGTAASGVIPITVLAKSHYTGDETLEVTLQAVNHVQIGATAMHTLTINDTLPELSLTATSATEGSDTEVSVVLSKTSEATVEVNYNTLDGSAQGGTHYHPVSGVLTFNSGETTKTVLIPTIPDDSSSSDTDFNFQIDSPVQATISNASVLVTIWDDGLAPLMPLGEKLSAVQSRFFSGDDEFAFWGAPEGVPGLLWVDSEGRSQVVTRPHGARVRGFELTREGLIYIGNNHSRGHDSLLIHKKGKKYSELLDFSFKSSDGVQAFAYQKGKVLYQTLDRRLKVVNLANKEIKTLSYTPQQAVSQLWGDGQEGWIVHEKSRLMWLSSQGVQELARASAQVLVSPEESKVYYVWQGQAYRLNLKECEQGTCPPQLIYDRGDLVRLYIHQGHIGGLSQESDRGLFKIPTEEGWVKWAEGGLLTEWNFVGDYIQARDSQGIGLLPLQQESLEFFRRPRDPAVFFESYIFHKNRLKLLQIGPAFDYKYRESF